jgi:uncharacterized membrane protein YdbT with pleckstrin-like domain
MGYPRRLLNADEEMVFDLRPHWKVLVIPAVLALIIVGGGSYGVFSVDNGILQIVIAAVALVLFILLCVRPLLRWLTTHFVVTTRRVIMREGLIARQGRDIPLFRVNDVTFSHTVFERIVGAGTLVVESAGEHGQVSLADIPHVEDVQREIYRLVEADDARRRGVGQQGGFTGGQSGYVDS